jgi:hypothetical protein
MEGRHRDLHVSDPVVTRNHEDRMKNPSSTIQIRSKLDHQLIGQDISLSRKLSVGEAAAHLRVSKSWLDKKRLDGGGPVYLKFGRRVVYDLRDLESWALSTRRGHTSEKATGAG